MAPTKTRLPAIASPPQSNGVTTLALKRGQMSTRSSNHSAETFTWNAKMQFASFLWMTRGENRIPATRLQRTSTSQRFGQPDPEDIASSGQASLARCNSNFQHFDRIRKWQRLRSPMPLIKHKRHPCCSGQVIGAAMIAPVSPIQPSQTPE